MARLRGVLLTSGFTDVVTHLQSGNVIVQSSLPDGGQVADTVHAVIAAEFGFDVPVLVRTPGELDDVIADNPFAEAAVVRPHLVRVIFLDQKPEAPAVALLDAGRSANVRRHIADRHIYIDYVDSRGVARCPAAYHLRVLGVSGTERNWRTVEALARLCQERYPD
jgi:uncharacterized protein (DUF1697 family)